MLYFLRNSQNQYKYNIFKLLKNYKKCVQFQTFTSINVKNILNNKIQINSISGNSSHVKKRSVITNLSYLTDIIKKDCLLTFFCTLNFINKAELNCKVWVQLPFFINQLAVYLQKNKAFHFSFFCIEMHRGSGNNAGQPHFHFLITFQNSALYQEHFTYLKAFNLFQTFSLELDFDIRLKSTKKEIYNSFKYLLKEYKLEDIKFNCQLFQLSQFYFLSNYAENNKYLMNIYSCIQSIGLDMPIKVIYNCLIDNLYIPITKSKFNYVFILIQEFFKFNQYCLSVCGEYIMYKNPLKPFYWQRYIKINGLLKLLLYKFPYNNEYISEYFLKVLNLCLKQEILPKLNLPYRYLLFNDAIFDLQDGHLFSFYRYLPLPVECSTVFDTDRYIDKFFFYKEPLFDSTIKCAFTSSYAFTLWTKIEPYEKLFSHLSVWDRWKFYRSLASVLFINYSKAVKQASIFISGETNTGKSALIDSLLTALFFNYEIGIPDSTKNSFQYESLLNSKVLYFNEFESSQYDVKTLNKVLDGSLMSIPQKYKTSSINTLTDSKAIIVSNQSKDQINYEESFWSRIAVYIQMNLKKLTCNEYFELKENIHYFIVFLRWTLYKEFDWIIDVLDYLICVDFHITQMSSCYYGLRKTLCWYTEERLYGSNVYVSTPYYIKENALEQYEECKRDPKHFLCHDDDESSSDYIEV